MVCMCSGILEGVTSEGGVTPGTAGHQEALRKSGLLNFFWKYRQRRGSTASSKGHCLQAFGCDLLSDRGGRWKAFLMGRIIG